VRWSLLRLCAGATLAWAFAAHAAPGDDLRRLVEQGRSEQAYGLGARHPELRGSPAFDYYFGIAAIDSGHAGEGVLALDRVLARHPRDPSARMQFARGYLALGDDVRARREFERALGSGPPAEMAVVIQSYLDLIRLRQSRERNSARLYIEAGAGVDTNVNADASGAAPWLPALGNVSVARGAMRRRDDFGQIAAGGNVSHPVAPGVALFGRFALDSKNNDSARELDLFRSGIAGGTSVTRGSDQVRLAFAQSTLWVGGARLRSLTGLDGEWSRTLDELSGVSVSAQWGNEGFSGPDAPREARYAALGFDYRQLIISDWRPLLTLGASYAAERNTGKRPDLGRGLYGMRVGFEITPQLRWDLSAGLSYLESRYDGPDPVFGATRRDHYAQVDAAATYLLDRSWSMRGELTLADNRSSLEPYRYTQELAALKLRYEFN
jgi:hypothetical protein